MQHSFNFNHFNYVYSNTHKHLNRILMETKNICFENILKFVFILSCHTLDIFVSVKE